jgi:hypothetical protein
MMILAVAATSSGRTDRHHNFDILPAESCAFALATTTSGGPAEENGELDGWHRRLIVYTIIFFAASHLEVLFQFIRIDSLFKKGAHMQLIIVCS